MDKDGKITQEDLDNVGAVIDLELREEKANTQRHMAWSAIAAMVVFTAVLFSPMLTDGRVEALSNLLGLFYIAQAGIVGAYMGVQAWMSKN